MEPCDDISGVSRLCDRPGMHVMNDSWHHLSHCINSNHRQNSLAFLYCILSIWKGIVFLTPTPWTELHQVGLTHGSVCSFYSARVWFKTC